MTRLLVDTHALLWWLTDDPALSATARDAIADPANDPFVSSASVWEIAIKRSLGKLEIEDRWSTALRQLDLTPLPVTAHHAFRVERLPWHHRDPFDRILVAQADAEGCTLVTADPRLSAYGIPVVPADS